MEFRKLNPQEHDGTRSLYEEVFPEDDKAFVDYYYQWKTKDNIIYVAEDEAGIHAMVHLNPFLVSVRGSIQKMHYIVAVATQKEYRHQGLMRRLLAMAEQNMQRAGETFTFLMPASEQIYLPFGYRFFCEQRRGILQEQENSRQEVSGAKVYYRPMERRECRTLARFVNQTLSASYEMFIYRDESYYERLQAEQRCQDGEVMVICRDRSDCIDIHKCGESQGQDERQDENPEVQTQSEIIGTFCTAIDHRPDQDITELREIVFEPKYLVEVRSALSEFASQHGNCRVAGCMPELTLGQEKRVPLMMGKAPGGGSFCGGDVQGDIFINEVV